MATPDFTAGPTSLAADINKVQRDPDREIKEGVVSEKLPELDLSKSDDELLKISKKWEAKWINSAARGEWLKNCEENEKYWLGNQFNKPQADKSRAMVDNLIFESLETYLPQMTRRNPEPLVALHSSEESNATKEKFVQKVKFRLADIADENVLRIKLKRAGRHWAIYLLGVVKMGWDLDKDIPVARVLRPKRLILDPEATIDEEGYTGDRIGERRKLPAWKILEIIGVDESKTKAIQAINEDLEKDERGTDIGFVEWWTPEFFFWMYKEHIILKKKNPHWNYDRNDKETATDTFGNETETTNDVKGRNHLPVPSMPYLFLSVFNLGDQPMDKTSLIGQNLANQDAINKRNRQIDKNADDMNGGMVVSLARAGMTLSQAKQVTKALRNGGVVAIPSGSPQDAIQRYSPGNLPSDVFNDLVDKRSRLRDIFGTSGSTPAGIKDEKTVRGKIITRGLDTDRIGGGVSEYLEQLADQIYNWYLQMLYVYDKSFQLLAGATPPKLQISVKEGSLLPKDSTTIANQAIELGNAGRMSLIDMYKALEFPDPEQMGANVWLEQNAPHILYSKIPEVAQVIQGQQQATAQQGQAETDKEVQKDQTSHEQEVEKINLQNFLKTPQQ